jgi:hypothetical protein
MLIRCVEPSRHGPLSMRKEWEEQWVRNGVTTTLKIAWAGSRTNPRLAGGTDAVAVTLTEPHWQWFWIERPMSERHHGVEGPDECRGSKGEGRSAGSLEVGRGRSPTSRKRATNAGPVQGASRWRESPHQQLRRESSKRKHPAFPRGVSPASAGSAKNSWVAGTRVAAHPHAGRNPRRECVDIPE